MKGVLLDVPETLLAERRKTGADRQDEMWDGVLHMNPPPSIDHQDFEYDFECWLRTHWKPVSAGGVYHNTGVASPGGWPRDYRVPDLVLIAHDRLDRLRKTHVEGGPTVVVEIRSPDDETDDKFDFYAAIGTTEVWVVDRDTKTPEVYVLRSDGYEPQSADAAGWLVSPATGVRLRRCFDDRISLQFGTDETTRSELPQH